MVAMKPSTSPWASARAWTAARRAGLGRARRAMAASSRSRSRAIPASSRAGRTLSTRRAKISSSSVSRAWNTRSARAVVGPAALEAMGPRSSTAPRNTAATSPFSSRVRRSTPRAMSRKRQRNSRASAGFCCAILPVIIARCSAKSRTNSLYLRQWTRERRVSMAVRRLAISLARSSGPTSPASSMRRRRLMAGWSSASSISISASRPAPSSARLAAVTVLRDPGRFKPDSVPSRAKAGPYSAITRRRHWAWRPRARPAPWRAPPAAAPPRCRLASGRRPCGRRAAAG